MDKILRTAMVLLWVGALSSSFASHTGKTLRMAITQDEGTLTPYSYQTGYPGYELMTLIYDTLYLMDESLSPQPWLAEETEVSEDGLTYTIRLKDGLVWQDGEALTSEDVAFTVDYFQKNLLGRFTTATTKVASVTTPDERTVVLTLAAPDATFLSASLTDVPILPEHLWSTVTDPKTVAELVGSGPYMLAEYRTDQFYRLVENPNFWGAPPSFDAIIAPVIKDQTATFQALLAGEIDVAVRNVSPELVERFQGQADLKVAQGPGFSSTILLADVTNSALADPEVRNVMAGLINYDQLVDNLLLGYGVGGTPGFLPPASPFVNPATTEYTALAPEEAKARLEAQGFTQGADGVYVNAAGDRLEFSLLAPSNNPIRLRAAELVAQDLNRGGVKVSVRTMENEALVQQVWPDFDVSKERSYELSIFGWSAPVASQARLGSLLHSDPAVGNLNLSGYSNLEADALIDEAAVTTDDAARTTLLQSMQEVMARDLPLITLFYQDGVFAYRPAVFDNWVFMAGQGIINKNSFVGR